MNQHRETTLDLKDEQHISFVQSGSLEVAVEDSGVVMSPEQLGKVCSPGVQFNVNKLQGGKGSRLGLFITKGIVVELHNGILAASSPGLGHGTTFTMTIPLYNSGKSKGKEMFPHNVEDLKEGHHAST